MKDSADNYGIELDKEYILKIDKQWISVKVFDGETIGQVGLSHGFIHYKDFLGNIGFCGVFYFIENSKKYEI